MFAAEMVVFWDDTACVLVVDTSFSEKPTVSVFGTGFGCWEVHDLYKRKRDVVLVSVLLHNYGLTISFLIL
jgi:hypothetical protein